MYLEEKSLVCLQCGTLISRAQEQKRGVEGIRQGKPDTRPDASQESGLHDIPLFDDYAPIGGGTIDVSEKANPERARRRRGARPFAHDAGRPAMRRGMPDGTGMQNVVPVQKQYKPHNSVKVRSVNWAKVVIFIVSLALAATLAGYLYIHNSLKGQIILARSGRSNDAQAYWILAKERLDEGYVDESIEVFRRAWELDLEKNPPINNVEGLLLLCQAYEAADRLSDAMELYAFMYKDEHIAKFRTEVYRNLIRLMLDAGEDREAGELMQIAYENTGSLAFRQQRTEFLPKTPETSLPSGRYSELKAVEFSSPQGFDVYYSPETTANLPDEGILYTKPIEMEEGIASFKAVCVSGRLVSDPMTVSYSIYLPSPSAPKARLAPGTYSRRQKVHLYSLDKDSDLRFFYTLDGSEPDVNDSPEYTGEAIQLHTGNVKLKAVAVNSLGKASYGMEVNYRIEVKPYPEKVYERTDVFDAFELMKTTLDDFQEQFGEGTETDPVMLAGFPAPCRRFEYEWGAMTAGQDRSGQRWLVVQMDMNSALCPNPRGVKFGDSLEDVISKFRNCTQPPGISGVRGLYYSETGMGRYFPLEGKQGMVKYTCLSSDGNVLVLEFYFTDAHLVRIHHVYIGG